MAQIIMVLTAIVLGISFLFWGSVRQARGLREKLAGTEAELFATKRALEEAQQQAKGLRERFASVVDIEAEISAAKRGLEEAQQRDKAFISDSDARRATLSKQYEEALNKYNQLQKEVAVREENLNDMSFGLYKPHFSFDSSEKYKDALEKLREREKELIRSGKAANSIAWTVNNDQRAGEKMVKQYRKVLLRAFNGECDAAIANVSWNNITNMEARVRKSYEAINQLKSVMQISIDEAYLKLKLDELRLTNEFEEKKHQEKEEQRRIREQIRDEEQAQREIDEAQEEAERSESEYQKLLSKAREEALKATGAQLEQLTTQISSFEKKLDEARQKKERAIARAQLTKSGFVYVISNIGSFGESVFKIGMTRRLEPMDRVNELGGASVPFAFDLHAMLYSDNAPDLEISLHTHFAGREVNLANARKEFYHSIELEEIETFVRNRGLSAQFIKVPEAREYRKTLALRAQQPAPETKKAPQFADYLFTSASAAQ